VRAASVRAHASAANLIAAAWVGYGWITRASRRSPMPDVIAKVISLIISPAWCATIVAPRMRSVWFITSIFTKPVCSSSAMARCTVCNGTVKVCIEMPRARASRTYIPTWAISGSV